MHAPGKTESSWTSMYVAFYHKFLIVERRKVFLIIDTIIVEFVSFTPEMTSF